MTSVTGENWRPGLRAHFLDLLSEQSDYEIIVYKKHEHIPNIVYRYRSIDAENIDASFALKELTDRYVWMADPASFNDPYDSAVFLDNRQLMAATMRYRPADISAMTSKDISLSEEELKQITAAEDPIQAFTDVVVLRGPDPERLSDYRAMMNHVRDFMVTKLEGSVRRMHDTVREKLRVACFTTRWDSMAMWYHYANRHQGICLEYDIGSLPPESFFRRFFCPVFYGDKGLDLTAAWIDSIRSGHDIVRNFPLVGALHKAMDWSYEDEWRFVIPDPAFCPDRKVSLGATRVILGEKAAPAVMDRVVAECRRLGIAVAKCSISAHKGNPTIVPIT